MSHDTLPAVRLWREGGAIRFRLDVPRPGAWRVAFRASSAAEGRILCWTVEGDPLERPFGPLQKRTRLEEGESSHAIYLPLRGVHASGCVTVEKAGAEPWLPCETQAGSLGIGDGGQLAPVHLDEVTVGEAPDVAELPPDYLLIPATTRCNYRCAMCNHGVPGREPVEADFPDSLADRLAACLNAATIGTAVALTGEGEPLLSPVFFRLVDSVRNPLVRFHFATNGSLLDEEMAEWVLASPFSHVNVSLDAASAGVYRAIRGGDFGRVVRHLEAFSRRRMAAGRRDLRLVLNMTLMESNLQDLDAFLTLAHRLDAAAYVAHLNDYPMFRDWIVERAGFRFDYSRQILRLAPALRASHARARARARALGVPFQIEEIMRPLLSPERDEAESLPGDVLEARDPVSACPYAWTGDADGTAVLAGDGHLSACCLTAPVGIVEPGVALGAALMAAWNSPDAVAVRSAMRRGRVPDRCRDANCGFVVAQRAARRRRNAETSARARRACDGLQIGA